MKKLFLSVVMFGFGIMIYVPKVNATITFSSKQLFTNQLFTQVNTEVNTGNSVVATSGWKEFYSDEGNFSIFVPDTSVTNLTSKTEDYSINIYHADTKKSSYIVGYVDYNKAELSKSSSVIFNNFLRDFLGTDVKFLSQQNITLGKYPGIEVEYQNENQKIVSKSRLFLVGQRLYILDISNSKAGDAQQFFNSFELENKPEENPSEIAVNKYS